MIDLHTHTLFSDGDLIPSEHVRRAEAQGYRIIAITDHADSSNIDFIVPRIIRVAEELNEAQSVRVIPGIELTHIPPVMIDRLVKYSRDLGTKLIVLHGETIVEPVAPGTNRAGIDAGVDILAHPGLITEKEVELAAEKGTFLEISARVGHSFTNGHVALWAGKIGAKLILGSDAHSPHNLLTWDFADRIVQGAGLPADGLALLQANAEELLVRIGVSV